MTAWHGNAYRITDLLWRQTIGHRWIPFTMGQWCGRNFDVSFDVHLNILLNKQTGENEKVNWDSRRSFECYNSEFVVCRKCPITRRCLWRVPRGLMCSKANLVRDPWACRVPGLLSDIHVKIHVRRRKNFNTTSECLAVVLLEDLCQLTWILMWKGLS